MRIILELDADLNLSMKEEGNISYPVAVGMIEYARNTIRFQQAMWLQEAARKAKKSKKTKASE